MSLIINGNVLTSYRDDGRKEVVIPSSVTKIESNAFNGCSLLRSVTIPSSVTKISSGAFKNCSSLESVKSSSTVILTSSVFINCPKVKI